MTIVLDGEVTHADSLGSKAVIQTGDMQRIAAGTGRTNRLVPVVSGPGLPDVVTFHTDAMLYQGMLEAHHSVTHATNGSRGASMYGVIPGVLTECSRLICRRHPTIVGHDPVRPRLLSSGAREIAERRSIVFRPPVGEGIVSRKPLLHDFLPCQGSSPG